ncbi:hypothetical protein Q3G72_008516 [Acer saccharum]|nr:hypothetical protein Q3G72_008516 [Acer saccharum]
MSIVTPGLMFSSPKIIASVGSAKFSPPTSRYLVSPPCVQRQRVLISKNVHRGQHIVKFCVISSNQMATTAEKKCFGFKNLTETFLVDVHRAEGGRLNVALTAPLCINGSSNLEKVENVAVRIELSNGCVGWGEVAVLPNLVTVDQEEALEKVLEACQFLKKSPPMTLNLVLAEIGGNILPGPQFASVRAGVEMALIDAVANSIAVPLWRLFGGVSNSLSTAITIPSVSPAEASELASNYCNQGFKTLKLQLGIRNLNEDIQVFQAIQVVHPHCSFILDANERYTSKQAFQVLAKLTEMGVTPILLEQPVHRDDWEGLRDINNVARDVYGVNVIADESCRSLIDVQKIVKENLTNVIINIKLAKFGVLGTLEIVKFARKSGLNLMIDSMVETRLATGFTGHLAAGLGCFKYVNLGMPFLLPEDPVVGGYEVSGAIYKFINIRGQGGFLEFPGTCSQRSD